MTQRTIGLLVLIVSLLLVGWGIASLLPNNTSGDVAAVESALRPSATTTTQPAPQTSTTSPTTTTTTAPDPPPAPNVDEPTSISPPRGLRIDRLDVDAPIDPYGVDPETGQMAVPDNVTDVGWYEFGSRPGQSGSAVLAAHVDLAGSGPGVFFDLKTLVEGDQVVVINEDGSELPFRVIARATYDKQELPLDVIFAREGPPVLTLITCGGGFNRNISSYDSNIVVYAVPDLGTELVEGSRL